MIETCHEVSIIMYHPVWNPTKMLFLSFSLLNKIDAGLPKLFSKLLWLKRDQHAQVKLDHFSRCSRCFLELKSLRSIITRSYLLILHKIRFLNFNYISTLSSGLSRKFPSSELPVFSGSVAWIFIEPKKGGPDWRIGVFLSQNVIGQKWRGWKLRFCERKFGGWKIHMAKHIFPNKWCLERLLCPIFVRQRKTPKTSNYCLKNRVPTAFQVRKIAKLPWDRIRKK